MSKITKLDVWQLGMYWSAVMTVLGLLMSALLYIADLVYPPVDRAAMSAWVFVQLPLSYLIGGFIIGLIVALIFNQISKWTGGLKVTIKK